MALKYNLHPKKNILHPGKCLGDLAEQWARKNKIPFPKGKHRRSLHDPEYLVMYNQWPGLEFEHTVIQE